MAIENRLPNPPWDEQEWAVYNDYMAQTWQEIIHALSTVHPSQKREWTEIRAQYEQNVAAIRRDHPRVRLRGTVAIMLP